MRQAQLHLDRPQQSLYRRVVLTSLKLANASYGNSPSEIRQRSRSKLWKVMRVKTFAEWDQEVVLRGLVFISRRLLSEVSFTHDELTSLNTRSLLIFDRADPMVPIQDGIR